MNLAEVTVLMDWIDNNSVAEYVKILPLKDVILDMFESTQIVDVLSPLLTETETTNG